MALKPGAGPPFLLRDVAPGDLDDLTATAVHLDSVNLPNDREALARIIDRAKNLIVGTSMIFAQHGSRRAPHVYFDVIDEERYSETLDRHFSHKLLRIGYNYKGLTEIGGLVVRPEYRGHAHQLGRLLACVRFLYMGLHRALFCDEVVSELMPPLEPDGTSLLWESLGRRFTGLSYQEADALSRQNKEFIRALFPQDPLYATLLPANVQALIGQVGLGTKPVERLLRAIGFEYAHKIDPFDGGPHFHARTDAITLVRDVRRARVVATAPRGHGRPQPMLVARLGAEPPFFLAARVEASLSQVSTPPEAVAPVTPPPSQGAARVNGATLSLPVDVAAALKLAPGDEAAVLLLPSFPPRAS